jgi:hypothetical protein
MDKTTKEGRDEVKGVRAGGARVGSLTLNMRAYYSAYHLWAARHFAALARGIEAAGAARSRFDVRHRAYVTNSILSAVAFLEAAINELYKDVADGHESYVAGLDGNGKRIMSQLPHAPW